MEDTGNLVEFLKKHNLGFGYSAKTDKYWVESGQYCGHGATLSDALGEFETEVKDNILRIKNHHKQLEEKYSFILEDGWDQE